MMFKYNIFLLLFLVSCTEGGDNLNNKDSASVPQQHIAEKPVINDSVINVNFAAGTTTVTVDGFIKDYNNPVMITVPVTKADTLKASLQTKEASANIRFNQIFMPDGSADGPFGKEINYQTKQQGLYTLKVGEDMMAEGLYTGDFTVTISLK